MNIRCKRRLVSVWFWIANRAVNESHKITNFLWTTLWRDINCNSHLILTNSAEKMGKELSKRYFLVIISIVKAQPTHRPILTSSVKHSCRFDRSMGIWARYLWKIRAEQEWTFFFNSVKLRLHEFPLEKYNLQMDGYNMIFFHFS